MTPTDRLLTLLSSLHTRHLRDQSPVRPARVLGRNPDGTERIQRLDTLCPTRSAPDNHHLGTVLLNPTLAALHTTGTTGLGTTTTFAAGTLWLETLDPSTYRPGQTVQVTVRGRGFDTATQIDFLNPPAPNTPDVSDTTLNPDLQITATHYLNPETLLLDLTVTPGARLLPHAPIAYGRPGLHRRKADAYAVTSATVHPRYYAFLDPADFVACLYASDGTWLADRGSIPLPRRLPAADNGILIAEDTGGTVAPGTLAWRTADNEITVWDVDNAKTYTYQATLAAYCSPPVHHAGRLWWIEFPAHEDEPDTGRAPLTLRSAACDLTTPQTETTVLFSTSLQSWDLGPAARLAATPTVLLFATDWRDNINHEVVGAAGARFFFGPTGAETQDGATLDLAQGHPAIDGTSVGLALSSNALRSQPPTLGAPSAPRWPTTGPWSLLTATNAAVTADGTTALLYGYPPEGDAPIVLEAPATATAGEPTVRVPVAPHPIHGFPPTLLFFKA
jgi:hypothetical protein